MSRRASTTRGAARPAGRRGISLVETVIASLLIALVLSSTMALVAPVVRGSRHASDGLRAARLAAELLDEALTRPFADPDGGGGALGTEAGEDPSDRAAFDDVDDYEGWSSSPPRDADGTVKSGLSGWSREARVAYLDPKDFEPAKSPTAIKIVRVVVSRDGQVLTRMESIVAGSVVEDDDDDNDDDDDDD